MSYDTILVEEHGAVTLPTLNRPKALNSQVLADMVAAARAFDADCMVVTGSEKAFAAGADIKEMVNAAFETTLAQGLNFERRLFNGLCATEDKAEGMSAFVAKRQGNWKGR